LIKPTQKKIHIGKKITILIFPVQHYEINFHFITMEISFFLPVNSDEIFVGKYIKWNPLGFPKYFSIMELSIM
jgi:hypothetical protein